MTWQLSFSLKSQQVRALFCALYSKVMHDLIYALQIPSFTLHNEACKCTDYGSKTSAWRAFCGTQFATKQQFTIKLVMP
uniref:Putative secreted protein n=1 Tax=Amblyomma cajennense TaxID=34607 RepID=A0A023FBN0_AMBCJ